MDGFQKLFLVFEDLLQLHLLFQKCIHLTVYNKD